MGWGGVRAAPLPPAAWVRCCRRRQRRGGGGLSGGWCSHLRLQLDNQRCPACCRRRLLCLLLLVAPLLPPSVAWWRAAAATQPVFRVLPRSSKQSQREKLFPLPREIRSRFPESTISIPFSRGRGGRLLSPSLPLSLSFAESLPESYPAERIALAALAKSIALSAAILFSGVTVKWWQHHRDM